MTDHAPTNELVISRVFNAPRELVYRAFTDPDQFSQWFGPIGYSVPRDSVDLVVRPGGHQKYTMVGDDDSGFSSPVSATFTEVIENELLVGFQTWEGVPGLQDGGTMSMRLEFLDEGAGTRLVITEGPYTDQMQGVAKEGWESSFTKLDKVLAG